MEKCIERKRQTVSDRTLVDYWGNAYRSLFHLLIRLGWYHSDNPAPILKLSSRQRPVTIVKTISNEQATANSKRPSNP